MGRDETPEWKLHTKWHLLPTFEEVRDVEYLRQSGATNMFSDITRPLFDRGLYAGVQWVMRCREENVFWGSVWADAMSLYTAEHGDPSAWFDDEFKARVKRSLREAKLREAEAELAEMEESDMP